MYSLTKENYLKAIYQLSQRGDGKISISALAQEMSINAASVVGYG